MKLNQRTITDKQLEKLLQRYSHTNWAGNAKLKKNYLLLMSELRGRRALQNPGILKKDPQDVFREINRDYYNGLSPSEKEVYLHYKWLEL